MNPYRFRLYDDSKIYIFKEACQKYQLDVVLLNKTNIKQNSRNMDKIKVRLKLLGRAIQVFGADNKLQNSTTSATDYLPGGVFSAVQGNIILIIDESSISRGYLENWIAVQIINNNNNKVSIINIYRISQTLLNSIYYLLT